MHAETERYYRDKNAFTPPERLACWTRLRGLAIQRGIWTVVPPTRTAPQAPPRPDRSTRSNVPPPPSVPRAPRFTASSGSIAPREGWHAALARFHLSHPVNDLLAYTQRPEGSALARTLVRACEAEARDDRLQTSHNIIMVLNAGLSTHPLSTATLNTLGDLLERRLIPFLDSVPALTPNSTWERTRTLLFDQQHLCSKATDRSGLRPIFYWWPEVRALTYYRAILTHARHANADTSPATARFLRFLMAMEGPVRNFWAYHPISLRRERNIDHTPCTCPSQKDHVARSLGRARYELTVELAPEIDALVHGEYVARVGPFLRSATNDMAHGVRRIYIEAQRRGNWELLNGLFGAWKLEACINGKLARIEEFLVQTELHDVRDVEDIVDLENKPHENDKVSEYLRVFRRQQRRALANAYGYDRNDVVRIERHPLFESDYFNDELFLRYVRNAPFLRGKSADHIRALVDYQIDPLWVLSRKPRPAVRGC